MVVSLNWNEAATILNVSSTMVSFLVDTNLDLKLLKFCAVTAKKLLKKSMVKSPFTPTKESLKNVL